MPMIFASCARRAADSRRDRRGVQRGGTAGSSGKLAQIMTLPGAALAALLVAHTQAADTTLWRNCHGPVGAYAAAWLVRRDTFCETRFGDSLGMEYHDYFLYHQGGNGRPRVALKSADAGAFFVEHLSQFEHVVVRHKGTSDERKAQYLKEQAEDAEAACAAPGSLGAPVGTHYPPGARAPLALVPFWGGAPEVDKATGKAIGNSHSTVDATQKMMQLRATLCGIALAFPGARLVVGTATDADFDTVVRELTNGTETSKNRGPALFDVLRVTVKHGAHLAFGLMRRVQHLIDSDPHYATDYVYFSEADQVVRSTLSPAELVSPLGQHVYAIPNRLHEAFPIKNDGMVTRGSRHFRFDQNICNGELVAVSTARGSPAPPHAPPRERAGRESLAAPTGPRKPIALGELQDAVDEAAARAALFKLNKERDGRYVYASADAESDRSSRPPADAQRTVFSRCWDVGERRMPSWFLHESVLRHTDLGRVREPLKDLGTLADHVFENKGSPVWHLWALTTSDATSFATCHVPCRSRFPPRSVDEPPAADDRPDRPARKRKPRRSPPGSMGAQARQRHPPPDRPARRRLETLDRPARRRLETLDACGLATPSERTALEDAEVVALLAAPVTADLSADAVRRSACSARKHFDAVVLGFCEADGGRDEKLDLLDASADGKFDEQSMADGLFVRTFACVDRQGAGGKGAAHDAAVPLVKLAQRSLKNGDEARRATPAWAAAYLFFAPLGDALHVADLDALKAVASPTVVVVPHRYHDGRGADAARVRPHACDNGTRDWITPLSPPDRRENGFDLTFYHLIPR